MLDVRMHVGGGRHLRALPWEWRGCEVASESVVECRAAGRARRSEEEVLRIARAKALLMERCALTEAQAHRCLQKLSMETSRPMAAVAQQVVDLLGA